MEVVYVQGKRLAKYHSISCVCVNCLEIDESVYKNSGSMHSTKFHVVIGTRSYQWKPYGKI